MTSLVLGTAQFGAGYGITNASGRIDDATVREILKAASAAEINLFDSAADYGDSQERLGSAPGADNRSFVTKFSLPAQGVAVTADSIFESSRLTLGVRKLHGVLFHKLADLTDERCPQTLDLLREARSEGRIERIGVSIYDSSDLTLALRVFPDLDLIQIPGSIVDRRLLDDPAIADLASSGVEVHVRSALLQGLLLANPEALPPHFAALAQTLETLRVMADDRNCAVLAILLGFLKVHPVVNGVVFGATSASELAGVVDAWRQDVTVPDGLGDELPYEILDPRRWPAGKVLS